MTDAPTPFDRRSLKPDAKALEAIARFEARGNNSSKATLMPSIKTEMPTAASVITPKQSLGLKRTVTVLWLFWTTFIIYGSLMPFTLREHDLSEALAHFPNFPWYNLAVVSRADWISNGVLYAVYMALGILSLPESSLRRTIGLILLFFFGSALAIGIEFTQNWFAPRTVSLNDVVAEHLGLLFGLATILPNRKNLLNLLHRMTRPTAHAARAALILYLAGLCLLALFPFDWFWSLRELKEKQAASGLVNLFAAGNAGLVRQLALYAAMILIWVPAGLLHSIQGTGKRKANMMISLLPLALQILTIPMFTNQATISSVVLAWLGIYAGSHFAKYLHGNAKRISFGSVQGLALWFLILYPFLLYFLRWHNKNYNVTELEVQVTGETFSWLPFYYQYFTTEAEAVSSLLRVTAGFVPIGIAWILRRPAMWSFNLNNESQPLKIGGLIIYALLAALTIELIGHFIFRLRPDMTNAIIGVAGALAGALAAHWLLQVVIDSAKQSQINTPNSA
jgi:VanZ family protein